MQKILQKVKEDAQGYGLSKDFELGAHQAYQHCLEVLLDQRGDFLETLLQENSSDSQIYLGAKEFFDLLEKGPGASYERVFD